jgi:prepilin-type N-terminal cleavage/methylation domain-containing protein
MRKLKAFTLVELLVAMVLSTIVIALAYSVYTQTNASFQNALTQYGKTNDLLQLQRMMNRDFNNACLATYENGTLKVERSDHSQVDYQLDSNKLIRSDKSVMDTFILNINEIVVDYLSQKPPVLETLTMDIQTGTTLKYPITAKVFYTNKFLFERETEEYQYSTRWQ